MAATASYNEGSATATVVDPDVKEDLVVLAINQEIARLRDGLRVWPPTSDKLGSGQRLVMLMRLRAHLVPSLASSSDLSSHSKTKDAIFGVTMSPAASRSMPGEGALNKNELKNELMSQYRKNVTALAALKQVREGGDRSPELLAKISELMKERNMLMSQLAPEISRAKCKMITGQAKL